MEPATELRLKVLFKRRGISLAHFKRRVHSIDVDPASIAKPLFDVTDILYIYNGRAVNPDKMTSGQQRFPLF
jgi:hypothetical protein